MSTFAQKQNQPQDPATSRHAGPNLTSSLRIQRAYPTLGLERANGTQAMQPLFPTTVEAREAGGAIMGTSRFEHDFSRIPIRPRVGRTLQTKLQINTPGDEYEQEADRISTQVMRMPEAQIQRPCACGGTCSKCQTEEPERLQTKHVGTSGLRGNEASPLIHDVLRSPGHSLDPATRGFMESRFGHDFSSVRVHTDERAGASAQTIHALGYTVGRNIVFGPGQYAPTTTAGRQLLAHELTHVVQQEAGFSSTPIAQRQADPMEQHANDMDMEMERKYANGSAPKAHACGGPSNCPAGFCSPYKSDKLAEYYRSKNAWWLLGGIAAAVDSRVVPFWKEYLWDGSAPKNLTADFGKDFTNSPTTKKTTTYLSDELKKSLTAKPPTVTSTASIAITTLIPKAIAEIGDPSSLNQMNFNIPRDIPGNLAGGIGTDQKSCPAGAQPSPFNDERNASGTVELTRKSGSDIVVTPAITYSVKDTVDLCPGDCGTTAEQIATVPLSQFEATGISGDVPFTVDFPAPALGSFTISTASPTHVVPIPATPVPAPGKPAPIKDWVGNKI